MALPEVASREVWLQARVDKNYAFEGSQGQVSLAEMLGCLYLDMPPSPNGRAPRIYAT